jgi:hypothetical protein
VIKILIQKFYKNYEFLFHIFSIYRIIWMRITSTIVKICDSMAGGTDPEINKLGYSEA